MPKNTAQRRIDSRRQNRATTISGVTLTGSPGSGGSAALAGDGLSYDGVALNVGAGTLLTVGSDDIGITAGSTYQFVGTGAGTAAAWQNLSTLAGAGLTHSAGVLAVGAGNGISVAADSVALASTVAGNGLTFSSGVVNVAVANTGATGLSVEADAVRLTSSSNPGAAAAILASTASGGLTLQSLAVQGSVDITNNGDLTVAGSGAYAGSSVLFVDSSGGNVGIMGAPDPQFALDVVGPCRATWFVGPHAIQLKDVLLLSHFDGRQPFETNYSGEPNGHMGQVATVSGGLIYRPGKFGTKAAQLHDATTNFISNPSFETGTTGWSATLGATLTQTGTETYIGSYALRITHVASTTSGAQISYSTSTAGTYTASAYLRSYIGSDVGDNCSLLMRFTYTDASTEDTSVNHTITDEWTRVSVTATTNGAKTLSSITVYLRDLLSGAAHYTMVDAVQLENTSYATAYCDGSLGSGHSWSGTAHASASTRTAAQLTYPTAGNIHDEVGTIMAWVYVYRSAGTQTIMRIQGSTAGNIYLLITSGNLAGYWGTAQVTDAAATITANTWTHVAMTYDAGTLTLYRNGVQVATGSSSGFSGMPATINVGGLAGANVINGLIDDFVITESVIDADGIRAVYESDAPVFAESSRFSFRATPQGLVWADDEGLWMRNSTGGTVLGAYGGSATKSWAGLTLDPSDVVIGDSARGAFLRWDDSAGTLQLGKTGATTTSLYLSGTDLSFRVNATERVSLTGAGVLSIKDSGGAAVFTFDASAGAEFTKPLTIGSSGGIYQGSGTFASPTTGLKIWSTLSGGTYYGRIAGYNGGDVQWFNDTSGRMYVGYDSYGSTADGVDRYAVRLARDGVRFAGERNDSWVVSSSSAAIRWVYGTDGVDSTVPGVYGSQYVIGTNNASTNRLIMGMYNYVGSSLWSTRDSIVHLQAQAYTGSVYHSANMFLQQAKNGGLSSLWTDADELQLEGIIKLVEQGSAPSAPGSNYVYIYAVDNGSGKTKLMAQFASGAAQQIAIQP